MHVVDFLLTERSGCLSGAKQRHQALLREDSVGKVCVVRVLAFACMHAHVHVHVHVYTTLN